MANLSLTLPIVGQADTTEEPKVRNALSDIQTYVNAALGAAGGVVSRNLAPTVTVASTSGTVAMGAAEADITGTSMTFTPAAAGRSIFIGTMSGRTGAAASGPNPILKLNVDGVNDPFTPQVAGSSAAAGTIQLPFSVTGIWVVSLSAISHTVKLRSVDPVTGSIFSAQLVRIELGS